MHRFFVPPEVFDQQPITLVGDQAHQIRRVLRMRLGDHALLLDGRGWAYEAVLIAVTDSDVRFRALQRSEAKGEPRTHISLFQAVLKGERFGWALQKGTEVGVSRFVPTVCERNVIDDLDAVEQKRERWERIIQEAAEQSGRGRLPQLTPPQLFAQAASPLPPAVSAREKAGEGIIRLIAWEGERQAALRDTLRRCNFARGARIQVFVGPEGGFTDEEVQLARRHGLLPVSLGPRTLRAETAGVVAAALILYEAGEI